MVCEIQLIINHNSKVSGCFEGVMVDEPNWKVKLWWNDGFAETTSSSVLARLSWRRWSFIQQKMSARHAEMGAANRQIIRMEWEVELSVISIAVIWKAMFLNDRNLVKPCRQKRAAAHCSRSHCTGSRKEKRFQCERFRLKHEARAGRYAQRAANWYEYWGNDSGWRNWFLR